MAKFIINGGKKLSGEVVISGAKNAALPLMAASILIEDQVWLKNVPEIADIKAMAEILKRMGAKIKRSDHELLINTKSLDPDAIPNFELTRNMRGSILIVGPLLARFGKVTIGQPGGCIIGTRPIDAHLSIFAQLGANITEANNNITIELKKIKAKKIILPELSVTATENAIMALALAKGKSEIRLAAAEPHCEELVNFLNCAGANISGGGTHNIKINGVEKLKATEFSISPDPIEIGTFGIAAAICRGEVKIKNINPDHLDMFLSKFQEAGVNYELDIKNRTLTIKPAPMLKAVNIRTDIWPGFPTDLQAPFAVLATQAQGTTRIFETMYEGRLNYLKELIKMGANVAFVSPHQALITGPTPLVGKEITSLDLRAGATLVLAALVAHGESVIENIELIDRGYEKMDEKLRGLGAAIKRM